MTERLDIIVRIRDAAQAGVRSVKKGLAGIGSTASATTGAIRGMYGQLAAVTALFAGGAFLGSAVKTFTQFDDVMRQAGAVTNATKGEMEAMTEQAKEMGKTTRFTASDAANGLRLLGMAGFEASESTAALPGVLNLAAAGSIDLGTAADIATNVLAGFGLEVENLGQVNDVLVQTFTSSNTTITELGEAFKLVGPIAKGVGSNFEDLFAAIGKLGDAGLKGTLAGTALRGAINALLNPTKEEEKLMEGLQKRLGGVALKVKDAEGNFIGFTSIIKQLEDAGLKGDEALKLFGLRAGPGMAALLNQGSEALAELERKINNAGGVSEEIADKMESGIGGAAREAAAAFEAVKIAIGEAFSEDIIKAIRGFRDRMLEVIDIIKQLKKEGTLKAYVDAVSATLNFLGRRIEEITTGFKELTKVIVAGIAAINGDLGIAKEALKDIGSDFDRLLVKRGLLESQTKRESMAIKEQINAIQNQIVISEKKIEQDKEDLNGWRAKIAGSKVYQKQLEKHQRQLQSLYDELDKLNKKKTQIDVKLNIEQIKEEGEYIDYWARSVGKKLEEESKPSGPIGTGGKKVAETIAESIVPDSPTMEALMKAGLTKLTATLQTEAAKIEGQYDQNLISLDEYFNQRRTLIERRIQQELALLRAQAESETDTDKRALINAQIFAKEQQLQTALLQLENERYEEQDRLKQDQLRKEDQLNNLRLKAEKAFQDQKARVAGGPSFGLEATFLEEQAKLQQRQNAELAAIQEFYSQKLQLLRENKAAEAEIEAAFQEQKASIEEQHRLQQKEKIRLTQDQEQRLAEYRLNNIAQTAQGVSQIFTQLYQLTGKKQKEFFYIAKAAAIAEATINVAQGVTKALAQGGFFGIITGTLVAAAGAIQIATIANQSLAEGGLVAGKSPTKSSDDKLINATSGEFMQPVDAVNYYGLGVMEAMRRKSIPKGIFDGFSMPGVRYGTSHFAEGGAVKAQNSGIGDTKNDTKKGQQTNIVNVLDPAVFEQWSSSTPGQRNILNVLSQNIFEVRQMVFDNQS
ncbi:MAG: phage tail tape measure protein [Desulfobacteraceae bacterium]|jgi:TP901 family phage tail tape measure protein